jgi:hypothetical protein
MHGRVFLHLLNCRGIYILMSTAGILVGLVALYEYQTIQRVETTFVETPAVIEYAKVDREVHRSRRGGYRVRYEPKVVFQYEAGGQVRESIAVAWYTPQFENEAAAEHYLAGLCRTGQTVCFVDPTDPATAVLDRHVATNFFMIYVIIGGALFLIGVLCFAGLLWFRANKPVRQRIGWNEMDTERPAIEQPLVLSVAAPAPNDPLARTRALMAQYESTRPVGTRS